MFLASGKLQSLMFGVFFFLEALHHVMCIGSKTHCGCSVNKLLVTPGLPESQRLSNQSTAVVSIDSLMGRNASMTHFCRYFIYLHRIFMSSATTCVEMCTQVSVARARHQLRDARSRPFRRKESLQPSQPLP